MHEVLLTDKEDLGFCCRVLKEEVSSSVNDKYSAVFTCRNADDQEKAIEILSHALYCSSELIAHEAAYALGQIKNPAANKVLIKCLK
ncbi:MAG: deoxyhypusine hydroxylase, partial [Paramarteilia canceri]